MSGAEPGMLAYNFPYPFIIAATFICVILTGFCLAIHLGCQFGVPNGTRLWCLVFCVFVPSGQYTCRKMAAAYLNPFRDDTTAI